VAKEGKEEEENLQRGDEGVHDGCSTAGEDLGSLPSVGGGERFIWGLQGLKTWWREKERRKELVADRGMTVFFFFADFGPNFLDARSMKSTPIYRKWKTIILSIQGKYFSH